MIQAGGPDSEANAVTRQGPKIIAAGRLLVGGSSDVSVVRLKVNGRLDRSFGGGDGVFTKDVYGDTDIAHAVRVLPDGRVLVVGSAYRPAVNGYRILAMRLTQDGRLDHTFGNGDGIVTAGAAGLSSEGFSMTLRPDGRFFVCGSGYDDGSGDASFELVRFKALGAVDRAFGTAGIVLASVPGYQNAVCKGVVGGAGTWPWGMRRTADPA